MMTQREKVRQPFRPQEEQHTEPTSYWLETCSSQFIICFLEEKLSDLLEASCPERMS
jgi:hypothetical protein